MRHHTAIVLFARTPQMSRSNPGDPYASLPWDDVDALFTAFLGDMVQHAYQVPGVDVLVYRNDEEMSEDFLSPFMEKLRFYDFGGEKQFAEEIQTAVENTFSEHYHRVLVLLENNPLITPGQLRRAIDQLGCDDDCVVVSPASDGRCALLGMKMNHAWVFDTGDGNPMTKPDLLMERLCTLETLLVLMPPKFLLDSGHGLARLKQELEKSDSQDPDYPRRSAEIFRLLDRKYKPKKSPR